MEPASTFAARLQVVREKIRVAAERSSRRASDITLVAVSKAHSVAQIQEAISCGQHVFGESYVQEALPKIQTVRSQILPGSSVLPRFDFVGHLQRNKVKKLVGVFHLIHGIDSLSLAEELSKVCQKAGYQQNILVQINVSSEASKSGVRMDEAKQILGQIRNLSNLNIQGFMSIGTLWEETVDVKRRKSEFVLLRQLRDEIQNDLSMPLPELSMGMSDDFELAIEEGATIVRVGTALFGTRLQA